MNDVSTELILLDSGSSSTKLALAAVNRFAVLMNVGFSCGVLWIESTSFVDNRDGVCDRDVARDEQRDDGLEFRDCRKSSNGISSDLLEKSIQIP